MNHRADGAAAAPGRPIAEPGSDRKKRVLRGTAWILTSYVLGNVLRLVSNLVAARLLFPEAFALLALAAILAQGLKMFSDIGIGPSIIQSQHGEDPRFLNTAWTFQVIRGVTVFCLSVLLAYPFAALYDAPDLQWIIPVAAVPTVMSGFNSTALFTMNRRLMLGVLTVLALGESVVKLVVTISWVMIHPSLWAILGGIIASQAFYTVAGHLALPSHRHRFSLDRAARTELLAFGRWVLASTTITFFALQSDRLMLGKLIPLDVLGVYSIALMFARLPLEVCERIAANVLFPALASIARAEPEKLRPILSKARRVFLTVGSMSTFGLIVVSPWFFQIMYDARYADAAWMTPLAALALWSGILQSSYSGALLALGDTRSLFLGNLANFVVTVFACLLGFHLGGMPGFIAGVAAGKLVGHAVIAAALHKRRLAQLRQDALFTTALLALALAGAWLPSWLSMDLETAEGLSRLAIQTTLGGVAGAATVSTLLSAVRNR